MPLRSFSYGCVWDIPISYNFGAQNLSGLNSFEENHLRKARGTPICQRTDWDYWCIWCHVFKLLPAGSHIHLSFVFLPPEVCTKYHLIYLERMKQSLFKGKSNAIQVILTSTDKTPEGFCIITENIRIGEALNAAFRTLGSCSAWVWMGLRQENPENIKIKVRSLMILSSLLLMMIMLLLLLKQACLYKGTKENSCWFPV